jgi:uncharacterized protein
MIPSSSTRIETLDVLRGLALFGMFVVHFHIYTPELGGIDDVIRTIVWRLVESKSHGTFAILFGAGFAIQLRRAEQQGRPLVARYLRRLAALAVFGFLAHALFGFNVLLGYAVWGVPLLLIKNWSTRSLILVAVLSAASLGLYQFGVRAYLNFKGGPELVQVTDSARLARADSVYDALNAAEAQPHYPVLFAARLRQMAWFYAQPFFFMPGATITLFVIGMLLVRHRIFEEPRSHVRLLVGMMIFGLVSWIAGNWLLPYWGLRSFGLLRDQWLTFTYLAGALLLLGYVPGLIVRLRPVANAGRMALTNYLLQIATLDLLFSGYGFGLGRTFRPLYVPAAAVACFAAEMVFSTIWLRHFRFGPAEWLWRSLTYGEVQPLRQSPPELPRLEAQALD